MTWMKVDTKNNDTNLLNPGAIHTFNVDNIGKFRYFRFTHTGKTTVYNANYFALCKIDFFGKLISGNPLNTNFIFNLYL